MINRAELKQNAKDLLKGNWGKGALISFIYLVIVGALGGLSNIKNIGGLFSLANLFITPPIAMGLYIAFLQFVKQKRELKPENIFEGFNIYAKSLGIYFWQLLWVLLWVLLLIIPGIIKAISYSMASFVIADNPNVKVRDALKISIKMTDGYKMDIFVFGLSFIGWGLLSILTLFIGFLWLLPYIMTTFVNLYLKLKEQSILSGACTEDMFNGTTRLVK